MPPFFKCCRHRLRGDLLRPYTAAIHIAARSMGSTFLPLGEEVDPAQATAEDEAFSALWSIWLMSEGDCAEAVNDPAAARESALEWSERESLEILPLSGSEIYETWFPIAREILDQLAIPVLPRGMERQSPVDVMPLDWWADYVADCHDGSGLTEPQIIETLPLVRGLMYSNLAARKAGFELEPVA